MVNNWINHSLTQFIYIFSYKKSYDYNIVYDGHDTYVYLKKLCQCPHNIYKLERGWEEKTASSQKIERENASLDIL